MRIILFTLLVLISMATGAQRIEIVNDSNGSRLTIDGSPFFLNGMNWDYIPIGKNYAYSLWEQPDDVIRAALDNEMSLMRKMGVNVIRQYTTIPPRWIQYIYEHYGIYTMINHSFGRYGLMVNGTDYSNTLYCKDDIKEELLRQADKFVNTYKNTPGVLMYLLGNENNYGLFWSGAESEDLPVSDSLSDQEARCMYELFNEAARRIKAVDPSRPVAICNGDLLFLDIIADVCKDVDILGVNCYRGDSFDVLFKDVKEKCGKPILFTEFGADAFNTVTKQEAQQEQAEILLSNWQEIYLNAAGMGQAENCIGGFTFQFSDGWWKCGQKTNLDIHDTSASWANGGYKFDYVKGENNMNEEWFGICAKGEPDGNGLYELYPRLAYKVISEVHRLTPYLSTASSVQQHFTDIKAKLKESK
ncbi:MAG: hypothetical protein IJV44_08685 [Prevotella sp.]|nr:hypothetical protein [Prevotella sp.]